MKNVIIGFDAKRAFRNPTGLGNYSRTIINALTSQFPDNNYRLYTPSVAKNNLFKAPFGASPVIPKGIINKSFKSYWRSKGIVKQLKEDGVDLYHGLSAEIPIGITDTGIKSVVTIHDLIFMRLPHLYKSVDRKIYLKKSQYAADHADRIIAISEQTKQDIIELLHADEKKIRVVKQGCNPWFYNQRSEDEKKKIREKYMLPEEFILYVGTIEARKSLLDLVKAMHEQKIDLPLVVIGRKTRYFREIQVYMGDNQIDKVSFYHHINNIDLPAVYQSAKIFVLPSRYEGFGIPVLEALNSGVPVITSRGGCLEETGGPGALFVDPGNVEEIGSAIHRILDDAALASDLAKKGQEHALLFREEKTIPELVKVYEDCLK